MTIKKCMSDNVCVYEKFRRLPYSLL